MTSIATTDIKMDLSESFAQLVGFIIMIIITTVAYLSNGRPPEAKTRQVLKTGGRQFDLMEFNGDLLNASIIKYAKRTGHPNQFMMANYMLMAVKMRDVIFDPNANTLPSDLPYSQIAKVARLGLHVGQRKLFLNELFFVARRIDTQTRSTVLYAGSAPSVKGELLAAMTPNIHWIFIDPAPFRIAKTEFNVSVQEIYSNGGNFNKSPTLEESVELMKKIKANHDFDISIINSIMTDEISQAVQTVFGQKSIYFVSDIRTNSEDDDAPPDSTDIVYDDAMQWNWIRYMRPIYAMLKFKLPFYSRKSKPIEENIKDKPYISAVLEKAKLPINGIPGIDFIDYNNHKRLKYYKGDIIVQPWAPPTSTESRLETDCESLEIYDSVEYDAKFYFYNAICRSLVHYYNPDSDQNIGFDHCCDCAFERLIWRTWLDAYKNVKLHPKLRSMAIDPKNCFIMLTNVINRNMKMYNHGHFMAPRVFEYFDSLEENYLAIHEKRGEALRFKAKPR